VPVKKSQKYSIIGSCADTFVFPELLPAYVSKALIIYLSVKLSAPFKENLPGLELLMADPIASAISSVWIGAY